MDPLSGIEIELVLENTDRIAFGSALADHLGGRAELGLTYTKVPIPPPPRSIPRKSIPGMLIRFIDDAAARHQAKVWRVAPDSTAVYLEHRSVAVSDAEGPVCTLVHDATLDGGERVCEIVTPPLRSAALLHRLTQVLGFLRAHARYRFDANAATHVHVEHAVLETPAQLARLISIYAREEPTLRTLLRTPSGLLRARSLPKDVMRWRPKDDAWDAARRALGRSIRDKDYALNLYNLIAQVPEKPTLELKIGAGYDDPEQAMAMRAAFVRLVDEAVRSDPAPAA